MIQKVLAWRRDKIQVQEESQMDQDLQHGGNADDEQRLLGRQGVRVYQVEGNGAQDDGEHEADEVGAEAAMSGRRAFHHSSPGR
jgi:hypothetical protein